MGFVLGAIDFLYELEEVLIEKILSFLPGLIAHINHRRDHQYGFDLTIGLFQSVNSLFQMTTPSTPCQDMHLLQLIILNQNLKHLQGISGGLWKRRIQPMREHKHSGRHILKLKPSNQGLGGILGIEPVTELERGSWQQDNVPVGLVLLGLDAGRVGLVRAMEDLYRDEAGLQGREVLVVHENIGGGPCGEVGGVLGHAGRLE